MPRKSEIDRMLVLFYRSNNAHGWTNHSRPHGWLDKLPMVGLEEFERSLAAMRHDVLAEIEQRKSDGHIKFTPSWHRKLEADQT